MEKYINEYGKECYRGCADSDALTVELFHEVDYVMEDEHQLALHTNLGSLTVLDRMTGFGYRDVETGYRDVNGCFWLASGNCNVITSGAKTLGEAIAWVKENANTCIPSMTIKD